MKAKDFLLRFAIAICFALTASNTFAYDFEVDGIYYNVTSIENLEVEVTSCDAAEYKGDVVIPKTVVYKNRKLSVTSIGQSAFRYCSGLTSIDISDGVTQIGDYAFYGCSGLTSIDIPDGLTEIGNYAFYGCSGLTSIDIPDGVTSIGVQAFKGCSGLTSVDIPDGVTSIGWGAFCDCSGLTSVDIPDGVTSIRSSAFKGCSGLTSVVIPESASLIQSEAFSKTGLRSVIIPKNVTDIGEEAFFGCDSLKSVIIEGNPNIGACSFAGCGTIDEFYISSDLEEWGDASELLYTTTSGANLKDGVFITEDNDEKNPGPPEYGFKNITNVNKIKISDGEKPLKLNVVRIAGSSYHNSHNWVYDFKLISEACVISPKEIYIGRKLLFPRKDFNAENAFVGFNYGLFYNKQNINKIEIGLQDDRFVEEVVYEGKHEVSNKYLNPYKSVSDDIANIDTVIYGDKIKKIYYPVTSASVIYLRSTTPPETAEWENSNYLNSILYVPQGTLGSYQQADVWKNFWDIREWDSTTTDIKSPTIDNTDAADVSIDGKQVTVTTNNPGTRVQIYNTDGVLVYDGKEGTVNIGTPGLYIIKAGNLTKKLLVK